MVYGQNLVTCQQLILRWPSCQRKGSHCEPLVVVGNGDIAAPMWLLMFPSCVAAPQAPPGCAPSLPVPLQLESLALGTIGGGRGLDPSTLQFKVAVLTLK